MSRYGTNVECNCQEVSCSCRFAALLAIAVPQMVPLLGLLSALSISTIMLLVPILIEMSTKWAESTRPMIAKNIGIFVIWLLILVRFFSEIISENKTRKNIIWQDLILCETLRNLCNLILRVSLF